MKCINTNISIMNKLTFIGIIPARYDSSRFPGKPLALIGGKMMIQRVWERVSSVLDNVLVATDDERIKNAVESFGGKAVMTSKNHRSGTDRCNEAYKIAGHNEDVIINIQGDEPFIMPEQIKSIMECFNDTNTQIATLVRPFSSDNSFEELEDWTTPKVVIDENMSALYFSRSVIPFIRGKQKTEWVKLHQFYTHVGMYAYRADVLNKITQLSQSSLEIAESLEQLRWIQNGYQIKVGITKCPTIGIDTPEDLIKAEKLLTENKNL